VGWPVDLHDPIAYAAIAAAAALYLAVDFFVGAGIVACVREGQNLWQVTRREFLDLVPNHVVLLVLGTATIFTYHEIGILALALFAVIVIVPQVLLPILLRPRPVTDLTHSEAVVTYATVLADELGADDRVKQVVRYAGEEITEPDTPAYGRVVADHLETNNSSWWLRDVDGMIKLQYDITEALLYRNEHWDCSDEGFPGGVGGQMIPLTSRILAIANEWAVLTVSGAWTVTHAQAIKKLEERADTQFDPQIVAAAAQVVAKQRMELTDYEPRVHTFPIPKLIRKAPRLGQLVSEARAARSD
jgi:hypothetical protein